MTTSDSAIASLVHPHQMEIQEFAWYDLILDARGASAYAEDHLPGAVHLPVHNADREQAAATGEQGLAVADSGALPWRLAGAVQGLSRDDTVLVYCDAGGADSLVWAERLEAAGFRVDVLAGGWATYRDWVRDGLSVIGAHVEVESLCGLPATGLCRAVHELRRRGQQVIDLSALAGQEFLPGLTWPCDRAPTQQAFDSTLLHELRSFSLGRTIWIRTTTLDRLAVPHGLRYGIERGTSRVLHLNVDARANHWRSRLEVEQTDAAQVLRWTSQLANRDPGQVSDWWSRGARRAGLTGALAELLERAIDPLVAPGADGAQRFELPDGTPEAVGSVVDHWLGA